MRDPGFTTVVSANVFVCTVRLVLSSTVLRFGHISISRLVATARSTYFVIAHLVVAIAVIISKQRLTELLLPILPVVIFKIIHTSQSECVNPLTPNDPGGIPRYDPTAKNDAIQPPEVSGVGRSPNCVGSRMLEGGDESLNESSIVADILERVIGIGIRQRWDVLQGRPLVICEGVVSAEALRVVLRIGRVVGDVVTPCRQIQRQHNAYTKDGCQHSNPQTNGMEAEEYDAIEVDSKHGAIKATPTSARAWDTPEHRIIRQGQGPGNPAGEGISSPLDCRRDTT
mmetsp:Transcript_32590/g.96062  ORF Transcript_32590/g.96062 Transcript_32590/m.96062 type:complete len:284 (-) Transcript_32590:1334-2185(-)